MNYDFIAIDFETANEKRMSVCCAALIFFKNGEIVAEKEWLVKPPAPYDYFNAINISIHGITAEMVTIEPEFNKIWDEFRGDIDGELLIAHNAPFDISVLRSLIEHYNLDCPTLDFICTCNVSRKTWDKQINYTLKNIGNMLGYIFNHHDAHDDAKTCGKILLNALKVHNVNTIDELLEKIDMRLGRLSPYNYTTCSISKGYTGLKSSKHDYIKVSDIEPSVDEFDSHHPFFEKKITFTGTLMSMTRRVAMQKVVDCGGEVSNTFTKSTKFLVMGLQDYSKFTDGKESTKTKLAKLLISEGSTLEIIDEDTFLRMI